MDTFVIESTRWHKKTFDICLAQVVEFFFFYWDFGILQRRCVRNLSFPLAEFSGVAFPAAWGKWEWGPFCTPLGLVVPVAVEGASLGNRRGLWPSGTHWDTEKKPWETWECGALLQ